MNSDQVANNSFEKIHVKIINYLEKDTVCEGSSECSHCSMFITEDFNNLFNYFPMSREHLQKPNHFQCVFQISLSQNRRNR